MPFLDVVSMNLIIPASLSEPPQNDQLMFRFLTQRAKTDLKLDVLLECEKEAIDLYFKYLKRKGLFDYIDDILSLPHKEDGIRLSYQLEYPKTILVRAITFQNVNNLVGQIITLKELKY